jgi:RNA polymerase sigma-70 factor (ECF subfamily)
VTNRPDDDWSLLERARREPAALAELFRRHRDAVFRHALVRTGDTDAANDITQELFLRLAQYRRPVFRRARFSTWLYRVTANLAADAWRRVRRETRYEGTAPEITVCGNAEHEADLARVLKVMATLPDRQRQAFELRILEQWSTEETAAAMQISSGAVKTHLHRALTAVRTQLEDTQCLTT